MATKLVLQAEPVACGMLRLLGGLVGSVRVDGGLHLPGRKGRRRFPGSGVPSAVAHTYGGSSLLGDTADVLP